MKKPKEKIIPTIEAQPGDHIKLQQSHVTGPVWGLETYTVSAYQDVSGKLRVYGLGGQIRHLFGGGTCLVLTEEEGN